MTNTINCLNCKSELVEKSLTAKDIFENNHNYYKCNNCGLTFIHPIPSEESFEKIYSSEYYGGGKEEKFNNLFVVKLITYFANKRVKRIHKHISNNSRIIDIGCGNGRFLELLHKTNKTHELHGLEIQPLAALRASKRLKGKAWIHTNSDIEKYFGEKAFDLITYIHVFEHIPNPAETLNQLENIIRDDGFVMIVIPNIESCQFKTYKKNWLHLDPPRHLHFYPPQLLIEEMKKRSFELISTKYFDIEQNPFGAMQSTLNIITKKRDILFERLKGNKNYAPSYKFFRIFLMKIFCAISLPLFLVLDKISSIKNKGATFELIFIKTK